MRIRLFALAAGALMLSAGCRRAAPRANEVIAAPSDKLPLDPHDPAWNRAPEHVAKLLLQDLVEPRLMTPSTPEVRVRSLTNGSDIAFRIAWTDPTVNDKAGPGVFADACAIQIPRKIESDAPDPQMGQAGRPVEVTYWRADWQASVNGRADTIREFYPNASIDVYPFEAKPLAPGSAAQKEMAERYAPAAALGNRRSGPREFPVEDLTAEGPGTLTGGASYGSNGRGVRDKDGWSVVITRRLPEGLAPRTRTHVAFAVWEGSHQETGARKMRTGWIPLLRQEPR